MTKVRKKGSRVTPGKKSTTGNSELPPRALGEVPPRALEKMTDKEVQALELRKQGATYEQIRKALGYKATSAAHTCVKRAVQKIYREPAEDVLKLELERLDQLYLIAFGALSKSVQLTNGTQPDYNAMDRCMRIIGQRANYIGIDQPQPVNVNVHVGDSNVIVADGSRDAYIEALRQARAGELPEYADGDSGSNGSSNGKASVVVDAEIVEDDDGE